MARNYLVMVLNILAIIIKIIKKVKVNLVYRMVAIMMVNLIKIK